jgi:hypothetical protein
LAQFLRYVERFTESEEAYRECLGLRARLHGPDHPETIELLRHLVWSVSHEPTRAEAEARNYLERVKRVYGEDDWHVGYAEVLLGHFVRLQGRYVEAEPLIAKGNAVLQRSSAQLVHRRFGMETAIELYGQMKKGDQVAEWKKRLEEFNESYQSSQ